MKPKKTPQRATQAQPDRPRPPRKREPLCDRLARALEQAKA